MVVVIVVGSSVVVVGSGVGSGVGSVVGSGVGSAVVPSVGRVLVVKQVPGGA